VPAQECAQGGPLTAHVSERWASPQPSGLILSEDEARYLFRVRCAALLAASTCLSRVSSPTYRYLFRVRCAALLAASTCAGFQPYSPTVHNAVSAALLPAQGPFAVALQRSVLSGLMLGRSWRCWHAPQLSMKRCQSSQLPCISRLNGAASLHVCSRSPAPLACTDNSWAAAPRSNSSTPSRTATSTPSRTGAPDWGPLDFQRSARRCVLTQRRASSPPGPPQHCEPLWQAVLDCAHAVHWVRVRFVHCVRRAMRAQLALCPGGVARTRP